jgi:hypothetical protein
LMIAEDLSVRPNTWRSVEMKPLREHAQFPCGFEKTSPH